MTEKVTERETKNKKKEEKLTALLFRAASQTPLFKVICHESSKRERGERK